MAPAGAVDPGLAVWLGVWAPSPMSARAPALTASRPKSAVATSIEGFLERVTYANDRGKRLVGSKRALAIAVKNNSTEQRCTMLAQWLRAAGQRGAGDLDAAL